jgi:Domain of unknown function (DUF4760)
MNNLNNPDEISSFRIRIVLGFASGSFAIAIILTGVFAFFNTYREKDKPSFTDTLMFGTNTLSVAAAATGAAYTLQSIRHNTAEQKKTRRVDIAREYINLWDEERFMLARISLTEMTQLLDNSPNNRSERIRDFLKQDPKHVQDATLILNLLEKVAIFWADDHLDNDLLRKFYQPIVIRCWDVLRFHVSDRREVDETVYKNLELLYIAWIRET